jgi:DNA repair exonuclease SbcCD ATPase subunit
MTWNIEIKNIGGIRNGEARIGEGVNTVRASNWQGKSSFLAAIKTALGVGKPLTDGAEDGHVRLETRTDTIMVALHRQGADVVREGDPLLTSEYDQIRARLFSALDETNPIRRAVRNGENLESLLTKPLDIEDIDARIAEKKRERSELETELDRVQASIEKIPSLEDRIESLEEKRSALAEKRDALSEDGTTVDRQQELTNARAERERVRDRVDRLTETIERIDERIRNKRSEFDDLSIDDGQDVESELETLREEFDDVRREADLLQDLYTANKRFFEADTAGPDTVQHDLLEDVVGCWVCGQDTTGSAIESSLDRLQSLVSERQSTVREYESRIEDLKSKQETIRKQRRQRNRLEDEISELEERRADREKSLEEARDRLEELDETVSSLEERVENETEDLTDVESELKYTEAELEGLRSELANRREQAERKSTVRDELDELEADIESLRTRKDRVERETRETFKRHMTELIDSFETGFEAARLTGSFELVVARDGRETSLDALSQGERELLGIIAGIAGYEAFDVTADVPILLLDNLGVLTDRNVERLVDYLRPRSDYLVFTSYPEHTAFAGNEIDVEGWTVVSGDEAVDTSV